MASQSELERYQADPVVNGLQLARDHGSVPEIYHNKRTSAEAPEVAALDGPEIEFGEAQLEVAGDVDLRNEQAGFSDHQEAQESRDFKKKRRERRRRLLVLLSLCIARLAIGFGVGFGFRHLPSQPASSSPFSPTNASLQRGIANDSFFAAFTLLDGTRNVIFQDHNGSLRHAVSLSNANAWEVSFNNIIATNVRLLTPMAAFLRIYDGFAKAANQAYLFYVDSSYNLMMLNSLSGDRAWDSSTNISGFPGISPFTISQHSKSFSAAAIVQTPTRNNFGVLLMFQDSTESIQTLYGVEEVAYVGNTAVGAGLILNSVTEKLLRSSTIDSTDSYVVEGLNLTNATFSNLCLGLNNSYTMTISLPLGAKTLNTLEVSFSSHNATQLPEFNIVESWDSPSDYSPEAAEGILIGSNLTALEAHYPNWFRIFNGTLSSSAGSVHIPNVTLAGNASFTKVAATTPSGTASPLVYVYSQVNESAFAETIWNEDAGSWSSNVIQLGTSK